VSFLVKTRTPSFLSSCPSFLTYFTLTSFVSLHPSTSKRPRTTNNT
jgi:hypothetical protein